MSVDKQQTAVEWLAEQLIPNAMRMFDATTCNAIEKAKEMEKEQMESAYLAGESKDKQYYNETFKSE
jgi:hypothetical protein